MLPADRRSAPVGPEVSWPAGYSDQEYRDGDYRDPGYQGPAAQDAGIAGTRTVRGFVETGQGWGQAGYAPDGYAQSSYQQGNDYQRGRGYDEPGYAGSSYAPAGQIEMAYPPSAQ